MEIKGLVSDRMLDQVQTSYVFLKDVATGSCIDSCKLAEKSYTFIVSLRQGLRTLQLQPFGIYLVGEPGKLTVSPNGTLCGTPLNELWNQYLLQSSNSRIKYETDRRSVQSGHLENSQKQKLLKSLSEEYETLNSTRAMNLMRENYFNPLNALAFVAYASRIKTVMKFDMFYALAGSETRKISEIVTLYKRMEQLRQTAPGSTFVDFTIPSGNMNGTSIQFSDYVGKGKYILVDFWASWCGPCLKEIPYLKKACEIYPENSFGVLGVAIWDKREDTLKALEQENCPWPQILGAGKEASEIYGFNGIPQIMLFSPEGKILARNLRGEEIIKKVGEYIESNK